MWSSRTLKHIFRLRPEPISSSSSSAYSLYISGGSRCTGAPLVPSQHRSINSTAPLQGWMDTIKGVFTGNKETPLEESNLPVEDFTLLRFADELKNARRLGKFKQYIVGRSSEATFADAFEKQEAIIRYLGARDVTGENLQASQKQDAAKHCKCTITDVENTLAKFTWARQAHKKMKELKERGKPLPKNMGELQKMMGTTPMDLARSNLAKSGQISRNALCPCGSKKRYKRCCGKD
uniref:Protein translocase subunit SecA n=1 Tax=Noccaea caerulescens TaxID=107243 RepID=A0A1J3K598_NOCCA